MQWLVFVSLPESSAEPGVQAVTVKVVPSSGASQSFVTVFYTAGAPPHARALRVARRGFLLELVVLAH